MNIKNCAIFSLFLVLCSPARLHTQCLPGQTHVRLEIDPDFSWNEVTWALTNGSGSIAYYLGAAVGDQLQSYDYCVPTILCTSFRIYDSYGDGIAPDGYYRIYLDDTLFYENLSGNYGFGEYIRFNCPVGASCDFPYAIGTGSYHTPNGSETWYSFTPDSTGTYVISTCDLGNSCPSKIWVYDHCTGIVPSENQTGASFYANTGCDNGAKATLYLSGGHEYFIRLKYAVDNCNDTPLYFSLAYAGPVVGCMDPAACNYNPLAMISDTCIYPGNPDCPNAPDLVVIQQDIQNTLALDFIANGDPCMVQEGCIRGIGNRYILRFDTHIKNIGNVDYFVGAPPSNPAELSDQFVWDPCHNHWHYRGYAEYILYNSEGGLVPIGSKNGFCVLDLECSDGGSGKYTCSNMGISAGCGDVYNAALPCQWIDITNIPEGTYTMVVRVNWDKSPDAAGHIEKDYKNNWAQVCFNLNYVNNVPHIEVLENNCPQYTDCLGEQFGSAVMDCNGICNGPALRGDFNQDTIRNEADVHAYLQAALADNVPTNACTDLFEDQLITLFDAALLQECNLHHDDVAYWNQRFPCQFPTGYTNDKDIVYLLPGALDTVAKTFDVRVVNPYNKLIGYEFSVSGLNIDSVENRAPGFDGVIQFDQTGEILALSESESVINKNILPVNLLRVHYSKLTGPTVCISAITSIVNSKYQQSLGLLADPNCITNDSWVNTHEPGNGFPVFVQPNPARTGATLFFANPAAEPYTVSLMDLSGRVLRHFDNIREESLVLDRNGMPAGIYLFSVNNGHGLSIGKLAWLGE